MIVTCYVCKRNAKEVTNLGYTYYYIYGQKDLGIKAFCDDCCAKAFYEDLGWRKNIILPIVDNAEIDTPYWDEEKIECSD